MMANRRTWRASSYKGFAASYGQCGSRTSQWASSRSAALVQNEGLLVVDLMRADLKKADLMGSDLK